MLEPCLTGFGKSSSQIQAEIELDPGNLPLFIVRQAGLQPVGIEAEFQRDAVLRELAQAHLISDAAIRIRVFDHAKYRTRPDLCAGGYRHAAHSRSRLAICAASLSPLNRESIVSCALREMVSARWLS